MQNTQNKALRKSIHVLTDKLYNSVLREMYNKHPDVKVQVNAAMSDMFESILRELKNAPMDPNFKN